MTGNSAAPHFGPDELDLWLAGTPSPEMRNHIDECCTCLELVRAEEALAAQLAALPLYAPKADLADRVMASVYIPDPFAIRSLQAARRRLLAVSYTHLTLPTILRV